MNNYFISQRYHYDCGIACSAMILSYFNIECNYKELLKKINAKEYATFKDIKDILSKNSISVHAYKSNTKSINEIKHFPVIIQIEKCKRAHFVVLFDFCDKNSRLVVGDPLKWRCVRMKIQRIEKYWSGYAMDFDGIKSSNNIRRTKSFPYTLKLTIISFILYFLIVLIYILSY